MPDAGTEAGAGAEAGAGSGASAGAGAGASAGAGTGAGAGAGADADSDAGTDAEAGAGLASGADLTDDFASHNVVATERVFDGAVWDLRRDTFEFGDQEITREYVDHPGAVAILALDDDDRALLIKQYRHPIATRDWELPAGLLDVDGESSLDAAKRELAEEADLEATDWRLLSEFFSSPGGSNETIRIFLARGLSATAPFHRFDEEAEIEVRWAPLDDVVNAVLDRSLTNSILTVGALSAAAARARGFSSLGDPDVPWPRHPKLRRQAT